MLERLAPPPAARAPRPARAPWRLLLLGCLALAAALADAAERPDLRPVGVDHLGPRDRCTATSSRTTGPSWKPLPVLFTTPFALAGDDGAPPLWLVVARAGGMLAFAMAYRLGARLAGPIAGRDRRRARCSSPTSSSATSRAATPRGCSSRSCLWAIERHLDGRRRDAFLLGFAAALLRPEVWPFIALYGLLSDRHRRRAP